MFRLLADAEAAVHNVSPEEVHFHEVGAVDAIADICGACLGLDLLGVERVVSTAPALGGGTVTCAHGILPVPVPAVTRLLQGLPVRLGPSDGELTTPTGAALLKALTDQFVYDLDGVILASGNGAGTRDLADRANVLPATLIETTADEVDMIECNLDDMSGQVLSFLNPRLFAAGALDVTVIPCQMKKNRPGIILQVLAGRADREGLIRLLLRETTTFGVRWQVWRRVVLRRRSIEVETPAGQVSVKLGFDRGTGELLQVAPEYEPCARAAAASGLPLARVCELARQAAREQAANPA